MEKTGSHRVQVVGTRLYPANLIVFARAYPKASLVTARDTQPSFIRHYGGIEVEFLTLGFLAARIAGK